MECFVLSVVLAFLATEVYGMHIQIEYGNFEALTCFTCPMKKDNEECNNWAPDIPCPLRHTVCKTVHRINDLTGESVHVDKLCAIPEQCSNEHVGCMASDIDGEIECVSCCTASYCNGAVPYNVTTSHSLSTSLTGSTASHVTRISWPMLVIALVVLCLGSV